ncbi:hypothetical protein [Algoriphagus sediminis]|uniref:Uncharacterized protein n=1 Tax=Algoriphagus sediminis TaxID=3057113 RepID=A0ABT7YH79_9BACT|nr:hypothetical protein [Algoriphagus sediminis]MDN3205828.1 hypothetical protein [Algoriphagus sediminis]
MKAWTVIRILFLLPIWLLGPKFLAAQTPEANELFQLRALSISDLNSLNTAIEGTLVYNPERKAVFLRDGSQWVNTKQKTYSGVITIENTGFISVTNVPFSPSRVEFKAVSNVDAVNLNSDNGTSDNDNSIQSTFGWMTGFAQRTGVVSFDQQVVFVGGSGSSIDEISRFSENRRCIAIRYADQPGNLLGTTEARFFRFLDNGFQIFVTDADDDLLVIYTAYQ